MEREPQITPDNTTEKRNRKMELMEERHRNAITAFRLEQFLSKEGPANDEYPTSRTPENKEKAQVALGKLKPILDKLGRVGFITKRETIEHVVNDYIIEKVTAQRAEQELKKGIEEDGKKATDKEMGSSLFTMRMGKLPRGNVEAVRQEGYFVIACFDDEDYKDLSEDSDKEESGGRFKYKMNFGAFQVDTLLIHKGWVNVIFLHERQHFINWSVFNNFTGFSQNTVVNKKGFPLLSEGLHIEHGNPTEKNIKISEGLNYVKDELLARIRDRSDPETATIFFNLDLYKHLQDDFSPEEQQEVNMLLKKIESELKNTHGIFDYISDARAILVYHLIDIPLLKFPERIRAATNFIDLKIKEFSDFMPDESAELDTLDKVKRKRLKDLRLDITGEVYNVIDLILGLKDIGADETERELKSVKEKVTLLRKEYDGCVNQV